MKKGQDSGMSTHPVNKIHLAGAYGISEILDFQGSRVPTDWNYPRFYPFWEISPGLPVVPAEACEPDPEALLVVLNLNQKVWDWLAPRFAAYQ